MTCIVGLEFDGFVLLGGDLLATDSNIKIHHTQPKVFNKNGVLFGYTTSYRFGQILEHGLSDLVPPLDSVGIYTWLVTDLVPNVKRTLKDSDYSDGGECLVGVRDQLWVLKEDFAVIHPACGFSSIGSGEEYALGSIFTSLNHNAPTSLQSAEKILQTAIIAACTFCPSVGAASTIISNGGTK